MGFIVRYKHGAESYISIPSWDKHQHPHINEVKSTIPPPKKHQSSTVLAPEQHSASTETAPELYQSTPSDSLSSDSLNPISSSSSSTALPRVNGPPVPHEPHEPEPALDALAIQIVDDIATCHPRTFPRELAIRQVEMTLAADWVNTAAIAATIRDHHPLYCHYWEHVRPKPKFIPMPHIWIRDGDWRNAPPKLIENPRDDLSRKLAAADAAADADEARKYADRLERGDVAP
jgi:hypothetical protein